MLGFRRLPIASRLSDDQRPWLRLGIWIALLVAGFVAYWDVPSLIATRVLRFFAVATNR